MEAHDLYVEQKNQELWWNGYYTYTAMTRALEQFSWGMAGGKGRRPEGYLEHPVPITDREKEAERQRKIRHTLEWVQKGLNNAGV